MKFYQLHSAEGRHGVFARLSPSVWLENELLPMWVVADPALIVQILRSPLTAHSDLNDVLKTVEAKHGIQFPNVDYACHVLPVLARNDLHPELRRRFATFLAGRVAELDPQLAKVVKSCLAPLGRKGRLDIVAGVVHPLVQRIFSILLNSEMPAEFLALHVTELLSFKTTVSHLRNLDARIARALAYLRKTTGDEEETGWKFVCLVFGMDTLAMMLTESVVVALRDQDGGKIARLPSFPIETGVPVSHRRAKRDFSIGGYAFAKGDLIRLQMQALGYSSIAEDHRFIFGAGAHACVGKQLSLRVWEVFQREFDALNVSGRMIGYETAPCHYTIFHKAVEIEVF
jgi:cytochrome P450